MCSSHATQYNDPSQGLLVGHRLAWNEDRASVTDVKLSGKRHLNLSTAQTQSIWSQAGGLCHNKDCGKSVVPFYILKQREYILGKKYVWDGKLHEWQLMVWASRNSHHCVGKQVWYLYTSACVRVQTCVLWPLNIIYLHLRGEKNILRYLYFMKQRPFESLLCHCWLAPVSLVSISIPGLSLSQKATFSQDGILKGHVPLYHCCRRGEINDWRAHL